MRRFRQAPDPSGAVFIAGGAARPPALGLHVADVHKTFPGRGAPLRVLAGISLDVPPGGLVSVIGPSGAGKSTLLGILAGLDAASAGTVTLYSGAGPLAGGRLGQVGYMPQRDLLLPWRTALDNAIAGLEIQGVPEATARAAARGLFRDFGLDGFTDSYPYALSGGMRQRVSFARSALAARGLMLLDEPFGALDALTRTAMQEWLLRIWTHLQTTIVLVTHDVDEAVLLSDRVYVLTPRPARVATVEPIALPRPRSLASLADPAFMEAKLRLLDALRAAGGLPPEGAA